MFFMLTDLYGQVENEKLQISHLSDDFYIFTTYNAFKGVFTPSNGMYVVTDSGIIMIDTPWDTSQFQPLLDSIKFKHKKKVVMCIATHSHEDRTAGLEYFRRQGIKTFTTKQTDEICKERDEKRAEFTISKDTVFTIGQHSFQTFYGGAGHSPDNIVIWFDNEKILYGGCLIKSVEAKELGYLGDANIKEWENTIKQIQKKFRNPKYIIPGHQSWRSNKSIDHTLKLIRQGI